MTDLRCTAVSSCFGRHLRFITHRIYWYLLLLFCFVRHKTQMHITAHNCSASAKSTLQPASSRAQQQQATPCTCGRYALYVVELLSNLRSVTHHMYLLGLCSSYMLHVFARSYQPGAVVVQTVLLLLYGLKSSRLCSLPWQQCGSRRQLRENSSTYAYHTCLSST